ncbi:beta-ketoacyl synthase N-terminal-like domain-containing protein [Candidatus Chlorohelix sp.]|uniref:beta-ketoacyl synthase N-terminal-like domain-containing protein n=1 Tax=Candidatus Chlorohelix sp. TaxID=3139201 RepID=UPI00306EFA0D
MSQQIIETDKAGAPLHRTPIAIVGMASIFPQARNLQEYWDNILNKIDSIVEVPPTRWKIEDYYDSDPKTPDKSYCKRGGFIPDVDFDPSEFGIPPNLLEATDVSQLLALLVAKDALEDAGYGEGEEFARDKTGVVLGVVTGQQLMRPLVSRLQYPLWEKVLKSVGLPDKDVKVIIEKLKLGHAKWEENSFPGFLSNVVAGRIANRLDLGGMNCVVDAACASSLSALNVAVNELASYRSDMMITGGVDIDNSILTYMCFSKTPAFSRKENVRPFDAESDGMMAGEGIGMLVLKRLVDAERDGDRVYAVIKGIGSSSDGRYKSIYAPSSDGQVKALNRAYKDAGFDPTEIGLVEAHGTGTVAGDLCEVTSLNKVFEEGNPRRQYIALGSVKSQIGHTKAAAGSASLIKTALALHHKILPPTINITEPNPRINIQDSPFYLNTQTRPWLREPSSVPRRAGVSAFGFGGTNFHVVMEEYKPEVNGAYRLQRGAQAVILDAATPEQLLKRTLDIIPRLEAGEAEAEYNALVEASRKLQIPQNAARYGFVAESLTETLELLKLAAAQLQNKIAEEAWEHPRGIFYRRNGLGSDKKIVALFSGQGSQYLEMGRELALNFPPLREAFSSMDALYRQEGRTLLSEVVYPVPGKDNAASTQALQKTDYAQPAIGAVSSALYKLMQQAGFKPDFVAGHSFGELTALWAAGVLDDENYYKLVIERGKAMAAPADEPGFDSGAMLAVSGSQAAIQEFLSNYPEITIANYNSGNQFVLAGAKQEISNIIPALKEKGFSVVPLPVSAAFHTKLVAHAQKPFANAINASTFNSPQIPIFSNTTGQVHSSDPMKIRAALAEHLLQPVQFEQEINNLYAVGGYVFIEIGPRDILTNLVKTILGNQPHLAVALNASRQKNSDTQFRRAAVQLRVAGLAITDIDPYMLPATKQRNRKSKISVKLNGSNYVSNASIQTFEKSLQDGYRVSIYEKETSNVMTTLPQNGTAKVIAPQPQPIAQAEPEQVAPQPIPQTGTQTVMSVTPEPDYGFQQIEQSISQLSQFQAGTLHVHEQYLNNQLEYSKIFFQLMQQQQSLLMGGQPATPPGVLESVERNMMRFHDHQADTLRVHGQYLNQQAEFASNYFQTTAGQSKVEFHPVAPTPAVSYSPPPVKAVAAPVAHQPAPVVAKPAPVVAVAPASVEAPKPAPAKTTNGITPPIAPPVVAVAPAAPQNETLVKALVEIVSDKTGYPTDMLELEMDMEADLGIDSIKRVEILGAMQDRFPNLPRVPQDELAELRTLAQIVAKMGVGAAASVAVAPAPVAAQAVAAPTANAELVPVLLEIVSDKTGYPTDMLELEMDMEADLGIDSIKRVEILGAMQDRFPNLPRVAQDELAELRTLAQIVAKLGVGAAPAANSVAPVLDAPTSEIIPNGAPLSEVRLKALPLPDYLEFGLPDHYICLLTDDGTTLTAGLAEALLNKGWRVVVLGFPRSIIAESSQLPIQAHYIPLEDMSEKTLEQTLKQIAAQYGKVGCFINLNPAANLTRPDGLPFSEIEEAVVKHVFLLAKYLKAPLYEAAHEGRACFLTVLHLDGALGASKENGFGAIGGGLFGLAKTLRQEWDAVYCRAIDLSPKLNETQAIGHLLDELHDPSRLLGEVGYLPEGRVTLVSELVTGR